MLKSLKYILNFEWLAGVPLGPAKSVFLVLFVLIALLVLFVPRDYLYEGVENRRWYHNLILWAWVDLAFIFIVYYLF